jgi:hypothetical protein
MRRQRVWTGQSRIDHYLARDAENKNTMEVYLWSNPVQACPFFPFE